MAREWIVCASEIPSIVTRLFKVYILEQHIAIVVVQVRTLELDLNAQLWYDKDEFVVLCRLLNLVGNS